MTRPRLDVIPPHHRVMRRVVVNLEGCWVFTGSTNGEGYGRIGWRSDGRQTMAYAHRVVYEATVGPIPAGMVIDHLCRNRACVNPVHLEPVTERTNILRGTGASARNIKKTHCPQGHALVGRNLLQMRGRKLGWRECRECKRLWWAKKRAA